MTKKKYTEKNSQIKNDENKFIGQMAGVPISQSYIIYNNVGIATCIDGSTGSIITSNADISIVLQYLITHTLTGGETIYFKGPAIYIPGSQCIFTKSVNLVADKDVTFNNILDAGMYGTVQLFAFSGTKLGNIKLTGNVAIGANSIVVTDVGTAREGDLVLIYDNTIWNATDYPANKVGELHEISSINGNTITIKDFMINGFTTANSGSIDLIRPITIEINGININGSDRAGNYEGVQLKNTKNSVVRNCKFENNGYIEIECYNCYNTHIENNIIGNNIQTGRGYGTVVSNASAFTIINNNYFYNAWHCISGWSNNVVGEPRDIVIINNVFTDSTGIQAVIDAHSIVESMYVYDNIIYSSNYYAVQSGAKLTEVIGNVIFGGQGCYVRSSISPGFTFVIANNKFKDTQYMFYGNSTDTPIMMSIKNNSVQGSSVYGIAKIYGASSFEIIGNQFDSTNTGVGDVCISLRGCTNGVVSGNYMHNVYGIGIAMFSGSNNNVISNNNLNIWNNELNYHAGIRLDASLHNQVSNNIMRCVDNSGQYYGIRELGTANYNRIFDNDLLQAGNTIGQRIATVGINSIVYNNTGFLTENSGAVSIKDGGNIIHNLAILPTKAFVQTTVAGQFASIISIDNNYISVAIKKYDGTPGTAQKIFWNAKI